MSAIRDAQEVVTDLPKIPRCVRWTGCYGCYTFRGSVGRRKESNVPRWRVDPENSGKHVDNRPNHVHQHQSGAEGRRK